MPLSPPDLAARCDAIRRQEELAQLRGLAANYRKALQRKYRPSTQATLRRALRVAEQRLRALDVRPRRARPAATPVVRLRASTAATPPRR
jgi:hypothetical protein